MRRGGWDGPIRGGWGLSPRFPAHGCEASVLRRNLVWGICFENVSAPGTPSSQSAERALETTHHPPPGSIFAHSNRPSSCLGIPQAGSIFAWETTPRLAHFLQRASPPGA